MKHYRDSIWYNDERSNVVYCGNCRIWVKGKLYSKKVTNHIKSIKHIKNCVIDEL